MGVGWGVSLVPAMTSSFIWSVNSRMGEEGERVTGEKSDLDGVRRGEGGESLIVGVVEGGEDFSRLCWKRSPSGG